MKDLKQQVAYLQGLAEGLAINKETKEGRIITEIIDVLEGIALAVEDLRVQQSDMETYLESIDDDLNDLEEDFYDDEEDDTDYVEVKCPRCQDIVCFDADILDDEDLIEVTCPRCNEVVFINDGSYDDSCKSGDENQQHDEEEPLVVEKKSHTEDL